MYLCTAGRHSTQPAASHALQTAGTEVTAAVAAMRTNSVFIVRLPISTFPPAPPLYSRAGQGKIQDTI